MNNDINLMTQREQRRFAYSKVFLTTALLFGAIFTFAFILTLYSLFLKSEEGTLSKDVASARSRIANYAERKQKILIVSERVESARNIISKRNNLELRTSQILSSIPDIFSIDAIQAKNDVVTVKLDSPSLLAFDDLLEVRLAAFARDERLGLKKIETSSFTRSGNYELTLAFYFSEGINK